MHFSNYDNLFNAKLSFINLTDLGHTPLFQHINKKA